MTGWSDVLEPVDSYRRRLPSSYMKGMKTDGIIFADDELMAILNREEAIQQVANVACLPGIEGSSMAMPDIHWGYGFPVGGVAAFDIKKGIVSPGGIGYDINCGVRLMKTGLVKEQLKKDLSRLLDTMLSSIPCGVGKEGGIRFAGRKGLDKYLLQGAGRAVEEGYGQREDLDFIESGGIIKGADAEAVSKKARERGLGQLGTLGAGNHFVEIQVVGEIYDEAAAEAFGLVKNMVTVMIHTGSRGFGHQVATDYIGIMGPASKRYGIELPDRQLACAPVESEEGQSYLSAMAAAANFAFANRQIISHRVREAFQRVLRMPPSLLGMELLYDVAHNIAKVEEFIINGKKRRLLVHRKGATRSLGPGHSELPEEHRKTGQVVLVPGDMGRYSFVMKGTSESSLLSFSSACHGAGRLLSRGAAKKALKGRDVAEELKKKGILVRGGTAGSLAEEASEAYKDASLVVMTARGAGIAGLVAKLKPLGVIKG